MLLFSTSSLYPGSKALHVGSWIKGLSSSNMSCNDPKKHKQSYCCSKATSKAPAMGAWISWSWRWASRAAHSSGEDGGSRTAAIKRRPLPCWRNRTFHNTTHCQATSTFLPRTGLQVYDVFDLTQRSWLLLPLRQPTTLHLESSRTFDNAHAQKRPCCTLRIGSIMK